MQGGFSLLELYPSNKSMRCKACLAATCERWVLWHRPHDHHRACARLLCRSLGARPQSRQEARHTSRLLCISLVTVSLLSSNNYSRVLVQLIVKRTKNVGTLVPAHWTQSHAWNSRAKAGKLLKSFWSTEKETEMLFLYRFLPLLFPMIQFWNRHPSTLLSPSIYFSIHLLIISFQSQ